MYIYLSLYRGQKCLTLWSCVSQSVTPAHDERRLMYPRQKIKQKKKKQNIPFSPPHIYVTTSAG